MGFGLRRSRKLIIAASALIMAVLAIVVTLIVLRHNSHNLVQSASSSSREIDTRARNFFHNGQIDSAVYYFTILSTRISHDQAKPADVALSCHANTSLATIYTNFFYDYPKAENYLMRADSIAQCNNLQEELGNIYLAQANLAYDKKNIEGNFDYQPDVMHMFTKAFYQAQRVKNIYYESERMIFNDF